MSEFEQSTPHTDYAIKPGWHFGEKPGIGKPNGTARIVADVKSRLRSLPLGRSIRSFARHPGIDTTVICPDTVGACILRSMFKKDAQNTYTIHLCKQGKEFQKILDFAGLFKPILGAVVEGKWKILGVTNIGPREAFVDVEEVNNKR